MNGYLIHAYVSSNIVYIPKQLEALYHRLMSVWSETEIASTH